jgi:hypothetical protein
MTTIDDQINCMVRAWNLGLQAALAGQPDDTPPSPHLVDHYWSAGHHYLTTLRAECRELLTRCPKCQSLGLTSLSPMTICPTCQGQHP